MTKKRFAGMVLMLCGLIPSQLFAQDRTHALDSLLAWHSVDTLHAEPIQFREFLARVIAHNLDYAVQKYDISIADAQIEVAKIYPDPTLSASFSKDVTGLPSDSLYGNILTIGASQTILLGGKISHGVAVANENKLAAASTVEEFFWTLRATAAEAYVGAVIADSNYKAAMQTYQDLVELAEVNAERVNLGDLDKIDYIQSRVDAIQARGAVLQSDASRRQAFLEMGELMGGSHDDMYRPAGLFTVPTRVFDEDSLIARAKDRRSDIIAARHQLASAQESIELARAMRWPDLTVGLDYAQIASTPSLPAPFPQEKELDFSLSIPLPISAAINRGSLDVAEQTFAQIRDSVAALELGVETSVRQAFEQYELALDEYRQYSTHLLRDAKIVRDARLYSYKAGNAELLDVLTAESTLTNVYQAYYTALSGYADALIALEQASETWDITF